MILLPLGVAWLAYQIIWYGWATLKQPVPCPSSVTSASSLNGCGDGCVGFADLILPSRVQKVDTCIQGNWSNQQTTNAQPNSSGLPAAGTPPLFTAPSGQPIQGVIVGAPGSGT